MNKYLLNNSKMAKYYSIFGLNAIQYSLRYLLRGQILQPRTITYSLRILLDLDTRASVFTSMTNLELGPNLVTEIGERAVGPLACLVNVNVNEYLILLSYKMLHIDHVW